MAFRFAAPEGDRPGGKSRGKLRGPIKPIKYASFKAKGRRGGRTLDDDIRADLEDKRKAARAAKRRARNAAMTPQQKAEKAAKRKAARLRRQGRL